jgi:hypothetical protein
MTNTGIGERVVTPGREERQAAVNPLTPSVEAERLAREGCEAFLSARIKTGSNLWK